MKWREIAESVIAQVRLACVRAACNVKPKARDDSELPMLAEVNNEHNR